MIDMHIHSSRSTAAKDTYLLRQLARGRTGLPTSSSIADKEVPERMIEAAAHNGLTAVSITDHWSCECLHAAERVAGELGMEYIPGIEIGALLHIDGAEYETHVLAYYYSREAPALRDLCIEARRTCAAGARAFLQGLSSLGIDISRSELEDASGGGVSGWAIRRKLVARGYAGNKVDATQIQQKAVACVLEAGSADSTLRGGGTIDAGEIIRVLHDAGASVFMAHPFWLTKPAQGSHSEKVVWTHIEALLALGVDGIEVYAPGHSLEQTRALLKFCRDRRLPACGGSDSHTATALARSNAIGDDVLASIKRHRAGLHPWE